MMKPEVDAFVRLASATFAFRCPSMHSSSPKQKLSFSQSFKTAGSHPTTQALTSQADAEREKLATALVSASHGTNNGAGTNVSNAARVYLPLIHKVLVSCAVQPEMARLDAPLIFEWASAFEQLNKASKGAKAIPSTFKSEAMMYEMVMTIASEAMGKAVAGCDEQKAGDYAAASRNFKAAAGGMDFLAHDQLPKWASRGTSALDKDLPAEATAESCDALKMLFLACGQQMAVATALNKPGEPNSSLMAKLCLGIAEQLESFMNAMRSKASSKMSRMDSSLFAHVQFQIELQKLLSSYFLSRSIWANNEHGVAIVMLREVTASMKIQSAPTKRGLPNIDQQEAKKDVAVVQKHMQALLQSWEKDNSTAYYDIIPPQVPEDLKLRAGTFMMKTEPYKMEENVAPAPLLLPARKMPLAGLFGRSATVKVNQ